MTTPVDTRTQVSHFLLNNKTIQSLCVEMVKDGMTERNGVSTKEFKLKRDSCPYGDNEEKDRWRIQMGEKQALCVASSSEWGKIKATTRLLNMTVRMSLVGSYLPAHPGVPGKHEWFNIVGCFLDNNSILEWIARWSNGGHNLFSGSATFHPPAENLARSSSSGGPGRSNWLYQSDLGSTSLRLPVRIERANALTRFFDMKPEVEVTLGPAKWEALEMTLQMSRAVQAQFNDFHSRFQAIEQGPQEERDEALKKLREEYAISGLPDTKLETAFQRSDHIAMLSEEECSETAGSERLSESTGKLTNSNETDDEAEDGWQDGWDVDNDSTTSTLCTRGQASD